MKILEDFKCRMLYATFKNGKERHDKKEEMIEKGWMIRSEVLDHDLGKVLVCFMMILED